MAALLHQRGAFSLHANMVALPGGGAAAFSGPSGAGKSTLAAFLDREGFAVLGDDLCAIHPSAEGPVVHAGIPRLKLWDNTLVLFERTSDQLEKVASDLDKYHVPLRSVTVTGALEPLPLRRIYLLERATDDDEPLIQPLQGIAAASAVLDNAFRWGIGQSVAGSESRLQLDQALNIARSVSVFRVARQWGEDRFFAEASAIAAHLSGRIDGDRAA